MSDTESQDSGPYGPFRYKRGIKWFALLDITTAFFTLLFLSLTFFPSSDFYWLFYPRELVIVSQKSPNFFTTVVAILMLIYCAQIAMAQRLLMITVEMDKAHIITRCQVWYWFSLNMNLVYAVEVLLLFTAVRVYDGARIFPALAFICVLKMILRNIGNHLVKIFILDLKTRPLYYRSGEIFSNPNIIAASATAATTNNCMFQPRLSEEDTNYNNICDPIPKYEFPPSYEEVTKSNPPDYNDSTNAKATT